MKNVMQNLELKDKEQEKNLKDLFVRMFNFNPHKRITIDQILKHEWVVKNLSNSAFYLSLKQLCEIHTTQSRIEKNNCNCRQNQVR